MQLPSAKVFASWPTPNYTDPQTRGPASIVILSMLLAIVTLVVGVRIFTRCHITHGFGPDDTLVLLAYIPTVAYCVSGIVGNARLQWNRHTWDVEPNLLVPGLKLTLTIQILFDAATNLTKLSMLSLVVRVTAASGHRIARRVALALAVYVGASSVVFLVVDVFQCQPVAAYWTLSFAPQHCIDQARHLLAAGIINTLTDLAIAVVFPVPFWNAVAQATAKKAVGHRGKEALFQPAKDGGNDNSSVNSGSRLTRAAKSARTSIRRRLPPPIVTGLLVGGLAVVSAGAVRTYLTWLASTSPTGDLVWDSAIGLLVGALELSIAIIVASLPATKPFFCRFLPALFVDLRSSLRQRKSRWREWYKGYGPPTNTNDFTLPLWRIKVVRPPAEDKSAAPKLPPDLNKPLPALRRDTKIIEETTEKSTPVRLQRTPTLPSVYDFQTHADGHISVHKASWEEPVTVLESV